MSTTDTPETDLKAAEIYEATAVPGTIFGMWEDFARRLERERDEARRIAQDWRKAWAESSGCTWEAQFPWSEITPPAPPQSQA